MGTDSGHQQRAGICSVWLVNFFEPAVAVKEVCIEERYFLHIFLNEIFLQLQLIYLFALSTMKSFLNCALSMKESGFNGKYVIKPRAAGILGISFKI